MNAVQELEQSYKQIRDYYHQTDKNPVMIAFGELAGFPNPITGNITTYMDLLRDGLPLHQIMNADIYDFQSLFFQKANFIQNVLEHNLSLEEIYCLLRHAVDATKEDSKLTDLWVRDSVKNRYPTLESKTTISDILRTNKGTIVLRSSLSNDVSYKIQENVLSVLGKNGRKHAVAVICDNGDQIIEEVVHDICENYNTIYALDPYAQIIEIGVELPKLFQLLNGNSNMKAINRFLKELVGTLKEELNVRNIPYITGRTIESTTFTNGQKKIYQEIVQTLAERLPLECKHDSLPRIFHAKGLQGMLNIESKKMDDMILKSRHSEENLDWHLYNEHKRAAKAIQKTIDDMQKPQQKMLHYTNEY